MSRREYAINIAINRRPISRIIIDPHYEEKHIVSISDEIILELAKTLDGYNVLPEEQNPPFSYFTTDKIGLNGKRYKLVWLLEEGQAYIGIVNAYRR